MNCIEHSRSKVWLDVGREYIPRLRLTAAPKKQSSTHQQLSRIYKRTRNQGKLSRDYVEGPKPYQTRLRIIKRRLFIYGHLLTLEGVHTIGSCLGEQWSHYTANITEQLSKNRKMDRSAFRSRLIFKPCQPFTVGRDSPRQRLIPSYHLCVILAPTYRFCHLHSFQQKKQIKGIYRPPW